MSFYRNQRDAFFAAGLGEAKDALRLLTRLLQIELPALKNNPWVMPPEAVVEKGGAVHKYLLEVEEAAEAGAEVRTLKLLKVVLVGSSRAGKTRRVTTRAKRTRPVHLQTLFVRKRRFLAVIHQYIP